MRKVIIPMMAAVTLLTAACQADSTSEKTKESSEQKVELKKTAAKAKDSIQPQDGVNGKVLKETLSKLPAEVPERVITTSVPIAEMLHLLGITPVGVPQSTNPLPKDFESIKKIGSPMQPDLEVISSLKPDLILGSDSLQSTLDKSLKGMDLKATYLPTESLDDLKVSFKTLGTYFDKKDEMDKVLNTISAKERELSNATKGKDKPTVMLMIGTSDSFMVMSEESYLGSLVKETGAENIASSVFHVKDTYSPINMEKVAAADPDVILVLASGDHGAPKDMFKKEAANNKVWKNLSAFKNDKVHMLDYSTFGVTSIDHVGKALTDVSKYLYQ